MFLELPSVGALREGEAPGPSDRSHLAVPRLLATQSADARMTSGGHGRHVGHGGHGEQHGAEPRELSGSGELRGSSGELTSSAQSVRAAPLATFYIEDDAEPAAPAASSATAPSSPVLTRSVRLLCPCVSCRYWKHCCLSAWSG